MLKPKARSYPIWSTWAILLYSLPVLVAITVLVFVLSDRSTYVELQIALLVISLCLFAFLTAGLYLGARMEQPSRDRALPNPRRVVLGNAIFWLPFEISPPAQPHFDVPGVPDSADDLVGCLMSLVLWALVGLVLVFLFWALAQVVAVVLPLIVGGLYWMFYRALGLVFAKSPTCRGGLLRSMGYALLYTVLYTSWIFAVLWTGHWLVFGA